MRDQNDIPRNIDTALVLTIAAWLIFNSHLERFYPVRWLAADGMLGNALFYMLSGYGIQSTLLNRRQSAGEYAYRRFIRLYPAVFVVLAFELVLRTWAGSPSPVSPSASVTVWFEHFVWPTRYTYVQVIVPFYALLWIFNFGSTRVLTASVGFAVLLFSWGYWTAPQPTEFFLGNLPPLIWWPFFWALVATGAICARIKLQSRLTVVRVFALLALLGAYFAAKYQMVVLGKFIDYYPSLHVLVWTACALAVATICDPRAISAIRQWPLVGWFVSLSAALTLEIFLVHVVFTDFLYGLWFPLNIMVLAAVTIAAAYVISLLVKGLRNVIEWRRARRPA